MLLPKQGEDERQLNRDEIEWFSNIWMRLNGPLKT